MPVWTEARDTVSGAARDLLRSFRVLAITDIAFKAIAFALLTPAVSGLLYWIRSGTASRTMADADIARFFITTRAGVVTLILGGSLFFAITALEVAALMAVGLAAERGTRPTARHALGFAASRSLDVLRLTAHMVMRLIALAVPFVLAAGAVYLLLLRQYDINYYLARRPAAFWLAGAAAVVIGATFATVLVRTIARWAVSLPLVVFARVSPARALGESARRSSGRRAVVTLSLAAWAIVALVLAGAATQIPKVAGRAIAPHTTGSLAALLGFVTVLAVVWGVLVLLAGVVNVSLFALVVLKLDDLLARAGGHPLPDVGSAHDAESWKLSGRWRAAVAATGVLAALGVVLLAFVATRSARPTLVIAHRGASADAPENTLAAFRLAADRGTDFVELDVQESADGQVLVNHDIDLMKDGASPLKVYDTEAQALRAVDIGRWKGAQFAGEHVPTLAEVLALCKGRCRVVVELKSYGHDQKLEERVADVVEAARMQNDCIFMSLDHGMVRKMKQLRPGWRCGLLVAKAVGDLTTLGADFLAVEARMASGAFVRRAHRAGQDVYVWTVNDPAWMLTALGRGVDGLITDKPDLARRVIERRAAMSDAERFAVAVLARLGARADALDSPDALRP